MHTVESVGARKVGAELKRFGLTLELQDNSITGSFWGEPEAGIVGRTVYARLDTPLHSVLHEAGHIICMDADRRACLNRDAGGTDLEEAAVCYLQVLLGERFAAVGSTGLMRDMDAWGYSFRLGSTADWFARDAADARNWLIDNGLIDATGVPTGNLRGDAEV